jgi:hypothetical protein
MATCFCSRPKRTKSTVTNKLPANKPFHHHHVKVYVYPQELDIPDNRQQVCLKHAILMVYLCISFQCLQAPFVLCSDTAPLVVFLLHAAGRKRKLNTTVKHRAEC